jgi:hypothetical protein
MNVIGVMKYPRGVIVRFQTRVGARTGASLYSTMFRVGGYMCEGMVFAQRDREISNEYGIWVMGVHDRHSGAIAGAGASLCV